MSLFRKLAAAAFLAPLLVNAQQPSGQIRIEVKDPSGAAVDASGHIKYLATGVDRNFTISQGTHTLQSLPYGKYRLEISKKGFTTQTSTVDLQSSTPLSQTFTLALGNLAFNVDVASTTPLPGVDLSLDQIAAPVQVATKTDIDQSGAFNLADFLNRRFNGVFFNEVQGNPFQPDVNYRGYTASPLLGTPQGLSIYMDGVRMNQPFGDVVSWDLIPRFAIQETALMPGSNPLFGLNTLGGALSIQTKDGYSQPGTTLEIAGGSFGRKIAEFEHGGSNSKGLNWYIGGNGFFEDGWRETSPTNVRQLFGKFGYQRAKTVVNLGIGYANNSLVGNGLQEQRFLARNYASVYTKPDITNNRSPFLNLNIRHAATSNLTFSGNAYYRHIDTRSLNGDINEDSLDQSLYQPNAAERAALAAAGYTGFPTSGETAANTPFPYWRCIGQVLLADEPGEKCNGLLNQTNTRQHNYGTSGQMSWFASPRGQRNQFTAGAAYDRSNMRFNQASQLGYLNPDRSVTGLGVFADGVHAGDVDGEPYDTRVNLKGTIHTTSVYITDTLTLGRAWNITVSGRYNTTTIDNKDRINPGGGPGSLDGHHVFRRFNPAAGITYTPSSLLSLYFSYSEGSRAPTSIELGCADPNQPCKLPNAMAGDPPLNQVVTRTWEGGFRGSLEKNLNWSFGWFRADNRNDILFVASPQTGFGYFKNFGKTLRQGLQLDLSGQVSRIRLSGGYTFLDATFRSPELVNGEANSTNDDESIQILPGNRIPLTPQHMLKAFADIQVTSKFLVDVGTVAFSSSYARGNENNQHQPDGTYYLGPGSSPAYAIVNLGARYQLKPWIQLFGQINNLFDRHYYTAAQLGPTGFTANGNFIARPFPAVDGEYPVQNATFYAPGAPRGIWGGLRFKF